VNDRCGVLRKRLLGRHVRHARLRWDFQGAAKFVDFFVDEQAVAALRQAFQRERAQGDAF